MRRRKLLGRKQLKKSMLILDTNAILRYLLADNEEMANEVDKIIRNSQVGIKTEIIAELVYVLKGVYQIKRKEISELILDFFSIENVYVYDFDVAKYALKLYAHKNIDFVDCLLISYNKITADGVFTFDKKVIKLLSEK